MATALALGSALYGLLCYRYFYGRWPVWIFNRVESAVREWRPLQTRLREEMMNHTLYPMLRTQIERNIIRKSGATNRRAVYMPRAQSVGSLDVKQAEEKLKQARREANEMKTTAHFIAERCTQVFVTPGLDGDLGDDPRQETDPITLPPEYNNYS